MTDVTIELLTIIKELANNSNIQKDTLLLDEGIIDSLSTIELITTIESKYSIVIDSDELSHFNFNTIDNIAILIHSKLAK